jgi:ergothioneine biosynthesis protein EgtB
MTLTVLSSTLLDRFVTVRGLTERLSQPLSPEDQAAQSMPDASPTKWHRAHTTWFFEEFLLRRDPRYVVFDRTYRYLFNSYYEAVGPRHPRQQRGLLTRPSVNVISDYRGHVEQALLSRLSSGDLDDALDLVDLGCHHEQQHQELILMDVKHLLSRNGFDPVYVDRPVEPPSEAIPQSWRQVDGGMHDIGHDGVGFAFDNECPRHQLHLLPFEIAERSVTNAEWSDFIDDGGYGRPELWLSDGWRTVQERGWRAPEYWRDEGGNWSAFTLSGRRPVLAAEPVCHVSFYEADAFARWANARLFTEQEWELAAGLASPVLGQLLDPRRCHPTTAAGGMLGNVWEWTSSAYLPYPGYRPVSGAVGEYNGKFMCDQHVLRGASAVTPAGHERVTYRNFFPASSRWVFSGLRLVRS